MAHKSTKGVEDEKNLITHSLGVQIPHCLGSEKTAQNNIWKTSYGTPDHISKAMQI